MKSGEWKFLAPSADLRHPDVAARRIAQIRLIGLHFWPLGDHAGKSSTLMALVTCIGLTSRGTARSAVGTILIREAMIYAWSLRIESLT